MNLNNTYISYHKKYVNATILRCHSWGGLSSSINIYFIIFNLKGCIIKILKFRLVALVGWLVYFTGYQPFLAHLRPN